MFPWLGQSGRSGFHGAPAAPPPAAHTPRDGAPAHHPGRAVAGPHTPRGHQLTNFAVRGASRLPRAQIFVVISLATSQRVHARASLTRCSFYSARPSAAAFSSPYFARSGRPCNPETCTRGDAGCRCDQVHGRAACCQDVVAAGRARVGRQQVHLCHLGPVSRESRALLTR